MPAWVHVWAMEAPAWTQPAAGYQSPAPNGNSLAAMTIEFVYDGLSRRISKKTTMTGTPTKMEGYLYDGWNVVMIAELNPANGAHANRKWSCLWKPDVGSSMHARASWQAAGGVGGLAWMQTGIAQLYYPPYYNSHAEIHVPMTDHMGNIRHYYQIKSTAGVLSGQISANFEYDAFGREVRAWGATTGASPPPGLPPDKPFTDELPFHFSSKFTDQESGLNYFGYRFYSPDLGRWLNRDPIGEAGGLNVYAIAHNRTTNYTDYLGLDDNHVFPAVRDPKTGIYRGQQLVDLKCGCIGSFNIDLFTVLYDGDNLWKGGALSPSTPHGYLHRTLHYNSKHAVVYATTKDCCDYLIAAMALAIAMDGMVRERFLLPAGHGFPYLRDMKTGDSTIKDFYELLDKACDGKRRLPELDILEHARRLEAQMKRDIANGSPLSDPANLPAGELPPGTPVISPAPHVPVPGNPSIGEWLLDRLARIVEHPIIGGPAGAARGHQRNPGASSNQGLRMPPRAVR